MAATAPPRLSSLGDEQLARLVARGDAAAFEALYDRHHAALLAFCRHMVGNREDGEDALQQTFLRAHRALADGRVPDAVRPWLFAIARNRCRTLLAARRDAAIPAEEVEPSFDGLSDDVARRADLRELVADLGRLPEDQRGALVLFELGGMSQDEIAQAIGCRPGKVKALVYQARSELIAERDARSTPCETIRMELSVARGGALRRGPLRRHLRGCEPCRSYREAVAVQRSGLASILPVAPSAALKAATLAGAGGAAGGAGAAGVSAGGAVSSAASAGLTALKVALGVGLVGAATGAAAVAGVIAPHAGSPPPVRFAPARAAVASATPTPARRHTAAKRIAIHRVHVPVTVASATPTSTSTPAATATPDATPAPKHAEPTPTPTATPAPTTRTVRHPRRRPHRRVVWVDYEEPAPVPTPRAADPSATATPIPHPRRRRRPRPRATATPAPTATPDATATATRTPPPPPRPRRAPTATPAPTITPAPTETPAPTP